MQREELLAQVASQYYEEHQTQAKIAQWLGTSRATVSRLLQEARQAGIVEITVHYPWKTSPPLQRALQDRFSLRHAQVLLSQDHPPEQLLRGLGILAARYVDSVLTDDAVLAISWGTAVYSTIQALRPQQIQSITVVQMIGAGATEYRSVESPELARLLAELYQGEHRYLHAPMMVEAAHLREGLLHEPTIQETLSLARRADVVLVGIGATVPGTSTLVRSGHLDPETLADLRAQGAVGDICAVHFDLQGRVLDIDFNRRVVSIELEALQNIPQVVGVACGRAKAEAILGALRGRHVNVLITDDQAAEAVLGLDEGEAMAAIGAPETVNNS